MSKERCFKDVEVVSQPVGLSVQSRGLLLLNANEGTEISSPVYESMHWSQRREVADQGFGRFALLHLPETPENMSLGATSRRRYPRSLAPDLYTRLILGVKSIRFQ